MMRLAIAVIAALGFPLLTPTDANADPKGKKIAFLVTSPTHPFIATLAKTFTAKRELVRYGSQYCQPAVRRRLAGAASR